MEAAMEAARELMEFERELAPLRVSLFWHPHEGGYLYTVSVRVRV